MLNAELEYGFPSMNYNLKIKMNRGIDKSEFF